MFKNMKIGTRLGLGFGLVLLLLSVIAFVGITRLSAVQDNFDVVVNENNVKIKAISNMRDSLNISARSVRNMIILDNTEDKNSEYQRILEARKNYEEYSNTLVSLLVTDNARTFMTEIEAAVTNTNTLFDMVIELTMAGREDEAREILLTKVRDAQSEWFSALDTMLQINERYNAELEQSARQNYKIAFTLMLTLAIAAALFSIGIAFWVTRSITRPIGSAVSVAEKLAEGA